MREQSAKGSGLVGISCWMLAMPTFERGKSMLDDAVLFSKAFVRFPSPYTDVISSGSK